MRVKVKKTYIGINENSDNRLKVVSDFDDLVFEKRNREYGAYQLRKRYNIRFIHWYFIGFSDDEPCSLYSVPGPAKFRESDIRRLRICSGSDGKS